MLLPKIKKEKRANKLLKIIELFSLMMKSFLVFISL